MSNDITFKWSVHHGEAVAGSGTTVVKDYDTRPLHGALIDARGSMVGCDNFSCYIVAHYDDYRKVSRRVTMHIGGVADNYYSYTATIVGAAVSMIRLARRQG